MLFANNANTTLASGITSSATSITVTSSTGFPAPTGSQYFYCTLADAATQTTIEIIKVTAVVGTTWTVVRAQDGTTGTIFASGAVVSLRLVAANLNDFPKLDEVNTFALAQTFSTPIAVGSGGTGLTTLAAGYIPYGNGTSAFSSSSNLQFNGTNLGVGTASNSWVSGWNAVDINAGGGIASGGTFCVLSANAYYSGANWIYKATGTANHFDIAGQFAWYQAPSGTAGTAITFTQAMTLDTSGNLLVGTTYGGFNGREVLQFSASGTSTVGLVMYGSVGTTGQKFIQFVNNGGTESGSITQSATGVLYNITSDRRLKSNIESLTNSGTIIDSLLPRTFTWNKDGYNDIGFVTDEYQKVFPNAITGKPNAVDEKGNPIYQIGDFSTSAQIAVIVAELQSLRARLKEANIA